MRSATALLLGASLVCAQEVYHPTVGRGPIPRSRFNGSDFDALSTPNASTSVNFTVGGQEWTWRVNITDFSVPEASIEGEPAPDARIVMATYDLQWPSDETLSETAASLNKQSTHANSQSTHGPQTSGNASEIEDPICLSVLDDAIVWPNVTNNYGSGSSSCEDLFGQECMRAILMDQTYSADGGCSSPSLNIDACEGVFDTSGSYTQSASSISSNPSNQTHPGDMLYYQYGSASPQSNTTAIRQAESRLRMILITLPNNDKTAACMRVDSSIDDIEVAEIAQRPGWDGSDANNASSNESESSSSGGDESGASARFAATLGSIGVVGVAVVMFGLL